MACTLFNCHWQHVQSTLIQQQLDAAIAAENQPFLKQLPNYTHYIHTAGTHGHHLWNIQFGLSQIQNRSGQTLTEEIGHQVVLAYIQAGHPTTIDLWYPP